MGHSISRGLKDVCLHSLNDKGKVYEMPGMCPICLYGKNQGLGGMLDSYKRIMEGMSKLVALIPDFKAKTMTDAVAQIIARMTKAEVENTKIKLDLDKLNAELRAQKYTQSTVDHILTKAKQAEGGKS